ncbi:MAG: Calx-beta domain-containing protein [Bacteroidales bacterium]
MLKKNRSFSAIDSLKSGKNLSIILFAFFLFFSGKADAQTVEATILAADINNGSSDACGIKSLSASKTTFSCADVGTTTVTLTVTDDNNNSLTCDATVTVVDDIDPVAVCKNITVNLDADGSITITGADIDNGSYDNYASSLIRTATPNTFNCTDIGANPVTLRVTDPEGNWDECTATVTVRDASKPSFTFCPSDKTPVTGTDGGVCTYTHNDNTWNPTAIDNCAVTSLTYTVSGATTVVTAPNTTLNGQVFEKGVSIVTWTATDASGNSETCAFTVTVKDLRSPKALCKSATVQLGRDGTITVLPAAIDNASTDNCGITLYQISKGDFIFSSSVSYSCSDIGVKSAKLLVSDAKGNLAICSTTITIEDKQAPTLDYLADRNEFTDNGVCTYTHLDNLWDVTDNCDPNPIRTYTVSGATTVVTAPNTTQNGQVFNQGTTTVTWTATDASGNSGTTVFNVIVSDTQNPTITCPGNITQNVAVAGNISATVSGIADPTYGDNCAVTKLTYALSGATTSAAQASGINLLSSGTFNLGTTTVSYTAYDAAGNLQNCTFTVTINALPSNAVTVNPTAITTYEDIIPLATFTVVLPTAPTGTVVFNVASSDLTEGTVSTSALTFNADNWNVPQTVTVTGVNDDVDDDNIPYTIVLTTNQSLTDLLSGYYNVDPTDVSAINIDNDVAGVTVSAISRATTEAIGTATFTMVLNTQPTADVTFTLSSSDLTEGTVSPASLTFTAANWNTTQTVTVTGIDDIVVDGNIAYTILTAVNQTSTTDALYKPLNPADVSVTNTDNDAATVTIDNVTHLEGNSGTTNFVFTVTHSGAEVIGGYSVSYYSQNVTTKVPGDYTAVGGSIAFTGAIGETKTITVAVNGDVMVESNESFRVVLNTVSAGGKNVTIPEIGKRGTGTITNDDNATLAINDVEITEGNTGAQTLNFTVTLSMDVEDGLTINYVTADGTATTTDTDYTEKTGSLTFTGTAGETKTIGVTINGDQKVELNETFLVNLSNIVTVSAPAGTVTFAGNSGTGTINNDDAAVISITGFTVDEAVGTANFSIIMDKAVQTAFMVDFATLDNTALAGTDYTAVGTTTLNFGAANPLTQTVTVNITNDILVEPTETLRGTISNLSAGGQNVTIAPATANGTILDNESASVAINDMSVAEDAGTATFTVTLTGNIQDALTVNYTTTSGSALPTGDYTTTTGTITFIAGSSSGSTRTIIVPIVDNAIAEPTETYTVNLSNIVSTGSASISDAQGLGTITDNDPAIITLSGFTVTETNGTQSRDFVATMSGAAQADVVITFTTTNGTAGATDFSAQSTVSYAIPAGSTTVNIPVTVLGDDIAEAVETFTGTILISNANGQQISIGTPTATGTIDDNDSSILSITGFTVNENAGTANFTVTLSNTVQNAFTVDFATSDITALQGSDYTSVTSALSFGGANPSPQTVSVPLADDALVESVETLLGTLSNLAPNSQNVTLSTGIETATAIGTINDNDGATLSIDDVSIPEGDSSTKTLTFTVTHSGGSADAPFTVNYLTHDATAVASGDYLTTSGTLSFTGATGETKIINVTVNGDNIVEATETFTVDLSGISASGRNVTFTDDQGLGTITDNDNTTVSIDNITLNEGNSGTTGFGFTVTLSGASDAIVTVDYATANGTATIADGDYTAITTTTLTFAPGETSKTVTVLVNGDKKTESDETFSIGLSNLVTNGRNITLGSSTWTGTITNDDHSPVVADISKTGTEDVGLLFAATDFTSKFSDSDGDALNNIKVVSLPSNGTLYLSGIAITAGQEISAAPVANITFTPTSNWNGSTSFDWNGSDGANWAAINEQVNITITAVNDAPVAVNDVTTTLEDTLVTLNVTTNDIDVDGTIDVTLVDLDPATAGIQTTYTVTSQGTYTVNNLGEVTFYPVLNFNGIPTPANYTVKDNSGATSNIATITITVTAINDAPVIINENISVCQGTSYSGTVINGDYDPDGTGLTVNTVLITTPAHGTFTINAAGSFTYVPDSGYFGTDMAVVSICDAGIPGIACANDIVYITIDKKIQANAGEDQNWVELTSFTVSGNDPSPGSGAWTLVSGPNTPTITSLSSPTTTITGATTGTYIFRWTISNGICPSGSSTVEINNSLQPAISISDATVVEGTPLNFTVTLSYASGQTITVNYSTADGTATIGDSDYTGISSTSVVFAPGENIKTISVSTTSDNKVELDETMYLNLASSTNATIFDNQGMGTILNDDMATLSVDDILITEGSTPGTVNAVFTVTLTNPAQAAITINYATSESTASASSDFTTTSGTLTFNPGVTTQTITVPITSDLIAEPEEAFTVTLSNVSIAGQNITIGTTTGTCTITDDDVANITLSGFTIAETNGTQTQRFVATMGTTAGKDIVLTFHTTVGTAIAGSDYTAQAGISVIILAGHTSVNIPVDILGDLISEPTESFTGSTYLSNGNGQLVSITTSSAAGNILDDDIADLTITKTCSTDPVISGQNLTYAIKVENLGSNIAQDISLTDILPPGLTLVSATPTRGTWLTPNWTIGTLDDGSSETLTIVATVSINQCSAISNTAMVTSTTTDPDPANNSSTATTVVLDKTVPTFTAPANITIYKNSNYGYDATVAVTGDVTDETDNCDNTLDATFTDAVANGTCVGEQVITRTWSLTDDCGNTSADFVQIINVDDNTAPTFTCPSSPLVRDIPGLQTSYTAIGTEFDYSSLSDNCGTATAINNLNSLSTLAGYAFPIGSTEATWTATDASGNASQCTFTVTVNPMIADLSIIKTIDNPTPGVDSHVVFTLQVTNNGPSTANGVIVNDLLPSGYTYLSDDGAGSYVPAIGVWTVGTMANGGTAVINITASVNAPGNGINYVNTAIVVGSEFDPIPDNNTSSATITVIPGLRSGIVTTKKAMETGFSAVGNVIHYNIDIVNISEESIYNISVSDPNAVISSGNPINILRSGTSATILATHTITQEDLDAGQVINCAFASGTYSDGTAIGDSSEIVTVTGLQRSQVTATKFASETTFRAVGDIIHYSIEVFNCGSVTLTDLAVSDPNAIFNEGNHIDKLAPRATKGVNAEHVVTQADVDAGKIANIAYAEGIDPKGKPVRDDSNEVILYANQPAQLVVAKFAEETSFSAIGDTIHYVIAVRNFRNTIMSDIVVSDPNAIITSGNPIFRLASGNTASVTAAHVITQKDLDAGKVVNVATARGTDLYDFIDKATSNEVTVFAKQSPVLVLTKTAEETSYSNIGDLIHYTNEIKNTGNVKITGITLTDPNTSTTGSNQIASLNPGESVTIRTTHTISQADLNVGLVEKTASISGNDPNNHSIRINSNKVIVKGSQQAQMTTALTAAENTFSLPGDVIHYTIEVRNTGNVTLTNLKITDQDAMLTNGNSVADLVPGAKAAVTAEHVVTRSDLLAGKLTSSATVTGYNPVGQQITSISNELTILANKAEGLTVSEVTQEAYYGKVGEVIYYTITVKNHGKVPFSNITVSDPNAVISGNQTIASLPASGFVIIAALHVVTQSDLDAGLINNTASIKGTYPDGTIFNEKGNPVIVYALKDPQLTTRFSATETSFKAVGDQIHYTIEVDNTGNLSVSDIVLSSQGDLTISGSPVLNLAPGNTARLSAVYTITVADLDAGKVVRAVNASGKDPDKQPVSVPGNEISVMGLQNPELSTIATAAETSFSQVGEVIHYNIKVKNSGNVSLISTAVTDPNAVIITVRPITILVPGESVVVTASHTITQADLDAGKVVSVATSAGFDLKGNTIEKKGNIVTVIGLQRHKLTVSNTASQSIFKNIGDVIVYIVVVKNTGNVSMNDIYVTDAKVLLDFSRTIASLAPGETDSVMAELRVTLADINAGKIVTAGIAHGYTLTSQKSYMSNEVIVRLSIENYNLSNFPNPFAYETTIVFDLPEKGEVILKVYDITGKEVGQIDKREFNQGRNFAHWNTFDTQKGLYILKMYYNSDLAVRVISVIN